MHLLQLPRRSRARDDDGADGRRSSSRRDRLVPKNLTYTTMTQYDKSFGLPFVLPPEHPDNILADVMARELEKPARRRDREVRARHLLLQRRKREALSGRRARNGRVAEGRDLRPEAGDERRGITEVVW
jgi:hypothetical protein